MQLGLGTCRLENGMAQPKPAPAPAFILRDHRADVQALCFHPDRQQLYTGDAAGTLMVWDLDRRRPLLEYSIHPPEAGVLSLHYLPGDSAVLLSQGRDGTLKTWELDNQGQPDRRPLRIFQTFSYNFCRCVIQREVQWPAASGRPPEDAQSNRPATLIAMSGSSPSDVELWDLEEGKLVRTLAQPEDVMKCGMCMALAFLPGQGDSLHLLAGYEDGTLALWAAAQPSRPLATLKAHAEPVMALAAMPGTPEAFSGSADAQLCKLRIDLAAPEIKVVKQAKLHQPGVADIALRQDGRILATAGWDHKVRIFSTKTCAPMAVLQYHRAGVAAVAFSARTGDLASAGRDKTVAFWQVFQ